MKHFDLVILKTSKGSSIKLKLKDVRKIGVKLTSLLLEVDRQFQVQARGEGRPHLVTI